MIRIVLGHRTASRQEPRIAQMDLIMTVTVQRIVTTRIALKILAVRLATLLNVIVPTELITMEMAKQTAMTNCVRS